MAINYGAATIARYLLSFQPDWRRWKGNTLVTQNLVLPI